MMQDLGYAEATERDWKGFDEEEEQEVQFIGTEIVKTWEDPPRYYQLESAPGSAPLVSGAAFVWAWGREIWPSPWGLECGWVGDAPPGERTKVGLASVDVVMPSDNETKVQA